MELKQYNPLKEEKIKIHGRISGKEPLTLFWSGSALELNTSARNMYVNVNSDYSIFEQWIRVEINGYSTIKMPVAKGRTRLCIFHGLETDAVKNVRIIKEVQPIQRDEKSFLQIESIEADGELYAVEDRKYKIEFIGDSITSGEGLGGSRGLNEWQPIIFTTYKNYAVQTATALRADYRIISQSGWGVYSSWDNNLTHTLPKVYEGVCTVLDNEVSREFGAAEENDFEAWQPNVVVVNLGTNDMFAFTSPAWTDPETGIVYKQRLDADGKHNKEDAAKFADAVYSFIEKIRKCNPNAYILWVYGMIGREMLPYIESAVYRYIAETKDEKVGIQLLPDLKEEWEGANNHPGIPSHTAAAQTLTERLKEILSR